MTNASNTYGYGSIYQRKDGRWIGAVEAPRMVGQKRVRRVFTGKTREIVEAKLEAYRQAVPPVEYVGRMENNRRARAIANHTGVEWDIYVTRTGGVCDYCGGQFNVAELTKDHRTPVSRGGSNGMDNIAAACWPCNLEKGTMTAEEYARWKARR